jgi:shikimate kinase
MKIFLIGLPGCGKTTMGKLAAQMMGRNFVDLDDEIVRGEGQSVTSIFAKVGEEQFRRIEEQYLKNWCDSTVDFIMATGGGTPCFYSNMDLMNSVGTSIFINTTVSEIADRMMNTELAKRPKFAGQDVSTIAGRIAAMRMERINFYSQAHITLSGDQLNPAGLAKEIQTLKG